MAAHRKRLRTTNMDERLNRELKRRTRVARLFPNDASLLRLVTAVLMEISEAALQASLDEIAPLDPRAKSIKPQDMIDRRYLIELEKSGVFAGK